jgi:hypothetical protein
MPRCAHRKVQRSTLLVIVFRKLKRADAPTKEAVSPEKMHESKVQRVVSSPAVLSVDTSSPVYEALL